jgi:hypothetical protein
MEGRGSLATGVVAANAHGLSDTYAVVLVYMGWAN